MVVVMDLPVDSDMSPTTDPAAGIVFGSQLLGYTLLSKLADTISEC